MEKTKESRILKDEDITPYLPYGLNLRRFTRYKEDEGTNIETDIIELTADYVEYVIDNDSPHFDIKPILKPLSYLKNIFYGEVTYEDMIDDNDLTILTLDDPFKYNDIEGITVRCYKFLLEHHFDVNNLLTHKLAVTE